MHDATRFNPARRRLLIGAAGVAGTGIMSTLPRWAQAQGSSSGPVRIIIASTPGTGGDTMSRLMQPRLQAKWDRPVIVENKPGASGVIGIDALAKSPADGQAWMIQTSTMFLLPYFYKQIPFDVTKDFTPLTQVAWSTFGLVVNANTPVKNYQEFVAWVKSQPGKLSYASPGNGTENHVFMEMLKLTAGLDILHVPYKGAAGAQTDVMGGTVPMMFLPIQTAHNLARKEGRLRIIGVTMKERFPLLPEIPSLHEQGATGFDFTNWYGAWGPAGMPADVTAKMSADLRETLNSDEIKKKFAEQGWVVKTSTPPELGAMSEAQYKRWGEIVAKTGIKPD
jgi:tripartite-type tricarboxylate transporter receptor subunit TctC